MSPKRKKVGTGYETGEAERFYEEWREVHTNPNVLITATLIKHNLAERPADKICGSITPLWSRPPFMQILNCCRGCNEHGMFILSSSFMKQRASFHKSSTKLSSARLFIRGPNVEARSIATPSQRERKTERKKDGEKRTIYHAWISNEGHEKVWRLSFCPGRASQLADSEMTHSFLSGHF